jgi:hypothetical protein
MKERVYSILVCLSLPGISPSSNMPIRISVQRITGKMRESATAYILSARLRTFCRQKELYFKSSRFAKSLM